LPILAGVFVDRYGFRRTLACCFCLFTIGYFLIGFGGMPAGPAFAASISNSTLMALVFILSACGGALTTTCIAGTVERTATSVARAFGFASYYALVNLGGAIGPILASQSRSDYGMPWVFVMSAGTSALMLLSTLLFFREPGGIPPSGQRSFA